MNASQANHQGPKLGVRIAIGLFVLVTYCSLPSAHHAQQNPTKQEKSSPSEPEKAQESTPRTTFALKLVSDGTLCPLSNLNCADKNIWWKDFALLTSSGHTLHLTSIPFPSVERAEKHFQASINGAEKILRREPESDSKGELIGERALGLFPAMKDSRNPILRVPQYRLFWTWGKSYLELEAEHLDDVLALESKLKEEGVKAVWTWH